MKLSSLPNIGEELERQLNEVGIYHVEQLKTIGSKEAWLKIQKMDSSACINRLMALEGAIQNIKKVDLPDAIKQDLKAFYQQHKIK